jgi:hypothetical protein
LEHAQQSAGNPGSYFTPGGFFDSSIFPERVQRLQKLWDSWNAEQEPPRPGFGKEGKGVWKWNVK